MDNGLQSRDWPRTALRAVTVVLLPLLIFAAFAAYFITLPYYITSPGSASPVDPLITVPKGSSFPPEGKISLTTVSIERANVYGALFGWLDKESDVIKEENYLGTLTPEQQDARNEQLMEDSERSAKVAALRRLGRKVEQRDLGASVEGIAPESAALGRLTEGDVIVRVNGRVVTTAQLAVDEIQRGKPGATIELEVSPAARKPGQEPGEPKLVKVKLKGRPSAPKKPYLGVALRTKSEFDFDDDVLIDAGEIGGPSAGLAFALGIIDELTPGELTGGGVVAVSGAIGNDGRVGDVGGIRQKVAAARKADAKLMLVPPSDYPLAKRYAGDKMRVVRVRTLEEALTALGNSGGDVDRLPPPPAPVPAEE